MIKNSKEKIAAPLTCVWEVTMGCNMRCGHCGSSCTTALEDELTTQEAFSIIDQMGEIGLKWVTLSGGEPTTRKDLPQLVKRLRKNDVCVNLITNGWLMDEKLAATLKECGVFTVAISIDGTEEIHDSIRKKESYAHAKTAFQNLKAAGIKTGAVTTISKRNLSILPDLCKELVAMGVESWQLQIGLPMGNLAGHKDWLILPNDIDKILSFCYETACKGDIVVYPADCIGYYTQKEQFIRQKSFGSVDMWDGCNAGVRSFGLLQNGDVLACTSIRDKDFVEANLKTQKLKDVWYDPKSFAWRRSMTKKNLGGDCAICVYASKCLGGCPNTRLTMNKKLESENQYCAYNVALKARRAEIQKQTNASELLSNATAKLQAGDYQSAAFMSARAAEIEPNNAKAFALNGYAEFMCGNYELCERANRRQLQLSPCDTYALKGLGLALHRQGKSRQGIRFIEKAARLTYYNDADIMNDLAVVGKEMEKEGNSLDLTTSLRKKGRIVGRRLPFRSQQQQQGKSTKPSFGNNKKRPNKALKKSKASLNPTK